MATTTEHSAERGRRSLLTPTPRSCPRTAETRSSLPLQLLAQRRIRVRLARVGDRLLHFRASDAARVRLDLVHHIAGRRRRAARREKPAGDEAATHRLLVGVPVPGDAIERLDYLRTGLIRRQGLRPCLRRERNQRKDQAEGAHGSTGWLRVTHLLLAPLTGECLGRRPGEARPRPAGEPAAVALQPRGFLAGGRDD